MSDNNSIGTFSVSLQDTTLDVSLFEDIFDNQELSIIEGEESEWETESTKSSDSFSLEQLSASLNTNNQLEQDENSIYFDESELNSDSDSDSNYNYNSDPDEDNDSFQINSITNTSLNEELDNELDDEFEEFEEDFEEELNSDDESCCSCLKYRTINGYRITLELSVYNRLDVLDECNICFEEDTNLIKTPCGHKYHKSCLSTWLSNSNNCPTCRVVFKRKFITKKLNLEPLLKMLIEKLQIVNLHKENKLVKLNFPYKIEDLLLKDITIENESIISSNITLSNVDLKSIVISSNKIFYYGGLIVNSIFENFTDLIFHGASSLDFVNNLISKINLKTTVFEIDHCVRSVPESSNKLVLNVNFNNCKELRKLILNFDVQTHIVTKKLKKLLKINLSCTKLEILCLKNILFRDFLIIPKSIIHLSLDKIVSKTVKYIDLSKNINLKTIKISNINIKELKLPNLFQENKSNKAILNSIEVKIINCNLENIIQIPLNIKLLDLSKNKLSFQVLNDKIINISCLVELNLSNNKLKSLPEIPMSIKILDVSNNLIESLKLKKYSNMEIIHCSSNKLKILEYGKNVSILNAQFNLLDQIYICKYINCIDVSYNLITNIYLSKNNISMEELDCSNNKLTNLNLYYCEIVKLNCSNNLLSKISNYENILNLNISSNPIKKFILYNDSYDYIDIRKTQITKLILANPEPSVKIKKLKVNKKLLNQIFYSGNIEYKYLILDSSFNKIKLK